jgi:DNA polymerase-3 subunit beta
MKLNIERAALLKALNHVQSVVERRNTIPILANVLMDARDDVLQFAATDLDIEISDMAPAQISRPGAITAPAHTLFEIVKKLPEGGQIVLDANPQDSRLTLACGRSRFTLPILPAADFPIMRAEGFAASFTIDRADLARLFDKTRFAISTEETRFYLNGVFLHVTAGKTGPVLRSVATDGHRLALAEILAPLGCEYMPGVIVPRKTVVELRRLLDDADPEVQVSISEQKVRFTTARTTLTSKVIDGAFPDYARVIPSKNERILKVENRAFAAAVDRVATISADKSRSVKMALDGDRLTLTVNNPDTGVATEEIMSDYGSDPLEIGFNARYLLDVASQIEGDEAQFEFGDAASPTLVRDMKDTHSLYVLMPLRV